MELGLVHLLHACR